MNRFSLLLALLFALTFASGAQNNLPAPGSSVKVSGSVMAANLLEHPQPICSPEHKGDPATGTVTLDAIIGRDGRVVNLAILSGPEWMKGCVIDAVSEWTYKPYLLDGVPMEVETTVTISIGAPTPPA